MTDAPCTVEFFAPHAVHVGTKAAFERLGRGLGNRGFDVGYINVYEEWGPDAPGYSVERESAFSESVIDRLPFPWKKLALAGTAFGQLVTHLRRRPPDVLVAGLLPVVAIAARDAVGAETKVLISVQGLPQADRIRRLIWPRLYPRAEGIVVPVQSMADRVTGIAGINQDRVAVEPNPVVTDELLRRGQAEPDDPWFHEDGHVVVAVGRQTRQKDFETLLRAFAKVREDRDVRLVVPGEQSEASARLERLVDELGLTEIVSFPGFVENVYAYMRAADVFVLSSRWEGPGHVLIEAMALGTPVVSTDCPLGPREILRDGEAGLLVPVGDHIEMARCIRMLLDNPDLRKRMGATGRDAAAEFHVDRAVDGYQSVIGPMCSRGGG